MKLTCNHTAYIVGLVYVYCLSIVKVIRRAFWFTKFIFYIDLYYTARWLPQWLTSEQIIPINIASNIQLVVVTCNKFSHCGQITLGLSVDVCEVISNKCVK